MTDLGTGNCPTFSPADDRIAFLSNADGVQTGVWLMKADGSERRLLGDYGRPTWSPDGRQLMIISFANPRQVTLMDANPDKSGVLQLPDHQIYADPSWAGEETIVAVIGPTEGDTLALIDVSDPRDRPRSRKSCGGKPTGPTSSRLIRSTRPSPAAASSSAREAKGMALYSVEQGKAEPAKRVEPEGYDHDDHEPRVFAGRPVRPVLMRRARPASERTRGRGSRRREEGRAAERRLRARARRARSTSRARPRPAAASR